MTLELDVENLFLPNTIDRGGRALIEIRNALVAKGWTVVGSGSGTIGAAFENLEQTAGPYDVFTDPTPWKTGMNPAGTDTFWHASGNAGSISHYSAWIRLREPNTVREFMFQRWLGSSSGNVTHGYMTVLFAPGGFTGGGADKDSTPSAPGGFVTMNSNTYWIDNSPGTSQFYMNMLVSDTARAGDVWPFIVFWVNTTTASPYAGQIVYESLLNTEATDDEPWVAKGGSGAAASQTPTSPTVSGWYSRRQVDLALDGNTSLGIYSFAGGTVPSVTWAATPNQDGKRRAFPVLVTDNLEGWKGRCEHLYWNPQNRPYPATHFVTTTEARLYWGNLLIPWKQNVTPAL